MSAGLRNGVAQSFAECRPSFPELERPHRRKSDLDENEPVYRYWLKAGKREKVLDLSELYKQGYLHGRFYWLEPDGTFLLRMVRSDADLFALDVDLP